MLPANGTEAKRESPPVFITPAAPALQRLHSTQKSDTDGIAAISGHNDDSMGKFSYSG
jgi:hypothetical protein